MRLKTTSRLALSAVAICGLLAFTGCSAEPKRERFTLDEALKDPTPELGNIGATPDQTRYREAINVDHNVRALRDDVSRFLFFKDASRLTPYATP